MRTVIFLGANLIALAIIQSVGIHEISVSDSLGKLMAFVLVFSMIMDLAEFIKRIAE